MRTAASVPGSVSIAASASAAAPRCSSISQSATSTWNRSARRGAARRWRPSRPPPRDRTASAARGLSSRRRSSPRRVGRGSGPPRRRAGSRSAPAPRPTRSARRPRRRPAAAACACRTTPPRSSSRSRSARMLVLALGKPSRRSVKRFGPSSSSRTTSSAHRSPTRSRAWAKRQASPYERFVAMTAVLAQVASILQPGSCFFEPSARVARPLAAPTKGDRDR